jgi:hypothetical protein
LPYKVFIDFSCLDNIVIPCIVSLILLEYLPALLSLFDVGGKQNPHPFQMIDIGKSSKPSLMETSRRLIKVNVDCRLLH